MKDFGFTIVVMLVIVGCSGIMKAIGMLIISVGGLVLCGLICQALAQSFTSRIAREGSSRADKAKEKEKENGHVAGVGNM